MKHYFVRLTCPSTASFSASVSASNRLQAEKKAREMAKDADAWDGWIHNEPTGAQMQKAIVAIEDLDGDVDPESGHSAKDTGRRSKRG